VRPRDAVAPPAPAPPQLMKVSFPDGGKASLIAGNVLRLFFPGGDRRACGSSAAPRLRLRHLHGVQPEL